jgi:pimeloyl-ACP methyl ester carboxylesterase
MASTKQSGYAPINGINLYHEIYEGTGTPLIVLHGGVGGIEMFGEVLPLLNQGRKVIGVDLQAHGRLAILPGITHYTIFSSPVLAATVAPFLDAPQN